MVLITRYLPSVTENNQPVLDGQTKDQIIDTVITSTTVGIINQLTILVAHSNSIFTTLANDANLVTQRIERLSSRIRPLIQSIPSIEEYHRNTSIDTMNSKPRAEYHADNSEKNQHFTHSSMPVSINTIYQQKCKSPPNLHLLDPYMDDGQKSLKLYTNPDFFMDEWVAEQQKLHEEARQRKRERREARLKKKGEKAEIEIKKVKSVTKVRYDPVTGEKITINIESPQQSRGSSGGNGGESTPQHHQPQQTQQHFGTNNQQFQSPPPPMSSYSPSQQHSPMVSSYTPPPPPSNSFNNRPPSTGFNTPPPPSNSFNNMPPPPSNQQQQYNPSSNNAAANRMSVAPSAGAPPPPPPPPPPSAPPPPPMFKGGANAAGGEAKAKPSGQRSDLLSSIMQGMALKPAEERKVVEIVKKEEALNVADILARRIAWAGDSDSSEDESDDSDWD